MWPTSSNKVSSLKTRCVCISKMGQSSRAKHWPNRSWTSPPLDPKCKITPTCGSVGKIIPRCGCFTTTTQIFPSQIHCSLICRRTIQRCWMISVYRSIKLKSKIFQNTIWMIFHPYPLLRNKNTKLCCRNLMYLFYIVTWFHLAED